MNLSRCTRRGSIVRRLFPRFLAIALCLAPANSSFAQQVSSELLHGLSWRLIGSFRGGRVTAVAGVAGDAKTYYMGTPGGGVWKTTNAGSTWFPIFDAAHVASIGDLVVAPSNPNVIYVATGEQTAGNGVWKSTDAGATWSNIGIRDSRTIPSILVDPRDANILYVAAAGEITASEARGIYKTTDGGKSWRKVFYVNDQFSPTELDFDPGDAHKLLAVFRHIPPALDEKPAEGLDTLLYRSADGGETWSALEAKGLPEANRGRVGLAMAPGSGGKRVFALMRQGLFRSEDGGSTWEKITQDPRILGNDYFGRVYCDPKNPDVVYVMQTSTYRSSDGGRTFSAWKGTPSGEDDHVLWIAPEDANRILMGTDQGAVLSFDGGRTWNTWFNQPTGQFYRVSTDNAFPYRLYAAQQDSGSIVIPSRSDFGLITYREWFPSGAFESSFIAPDPLNANKIYSMGWYGNVVRMERSTGQIETVFIPPTTYRNAWETPITFSPRDPRALYYGSQFLLRTLDGGIHWKEISPDLTVSAAPPPTTPPTAAPPATAKPSAGTSRAAGHFSSKEDFDFAGPEEDAEEGAQAPRRGQIQSIAPSPLESNLIWVGTTTGLIHVTRDAATWTEVTPAGLPARAAINCVEPSHFDANTAFAAIFVRRDRHPYFYRTLDGGKSWEKMINGLPEEGIARVVREDPVRKGLLFAGTETGVYLSFDSGDHWQPLQLNLPTSSVRDLAIHGDDLVAATFGRALWILDDISPLRQITPDVFRSAAHFFAPGTATRVHWDNHPDTPLQADMPAAKNPPDGAILYYSLGATPKSEITLDVLDEKGTRVRHFSSLPATESLPPANVPEYWFAPPASLPTAAGVNRFVWDLRYPHPTALPYGFFGERLEYTEYTLPDHAVPGETPRFQPPGPVVPPGTYELVLTLDRKSYHQKLRVVPDPRVHISAEDFAAQFDLSRRMSDLMNESARSFGVLSPLRAQLDDRKKALAGGLPKELSDALAEVAKQVQALESSSDANPGFGTMNRNLARYLQMVESADAAPASSARDAVKVACEEYAKSLTSLNKLVTETIPALNKLLVAQKLTPIDAKASAAVGAACGP